MAFAPDSTVLNAIAWLELYGFIDKLRRIVRTTGLLGPRVRQTSNAYVLTFRKVSEVSPPTSSTWPPITTTGLHQKSYSEVKKGFQGSGFDLGLNFGVGAA